MEIKGQENYTLWRTKFESDLKHFMFMKPELLADQIRCKPGSSRQKLFLNNAKGILRSAGSIVSGTARAISRIRASSDQSSSLLKTTSAFGIYFTQKTKKSPNRLRAWRGCIRWSDCLNSFEINQLFTILKYDIKLLLANVFLIYYLFVDTPT